MYFNIYLHVCKDHKINEKIHLIFNIVIILTTHIFSYFVVFFFFILPLSLSFLLFNIVNIILLAFYYYFTLNKFIINWRLVYGFSLIYFFFMLTLISCYIRGIF